MSENGQRGWAVTCCDVAENLSVLSNETRNDLIMWPKERKQLARFYSNVNLLESVRG